MNNRIVSVFSPKVSKEVMDFYIDSIKTDKEYSMMACRDRVFPLKSLSNERMTKVEIGASDVEKMCKDDRNRMYIHTHGNFLPAPSLMDHKANEKIFQLPDVNFSCIAGTTGVYCTDRHGEELVYPWGSNYFASVEADGAVKIERGDSLFCDRIGSQYDCEITKEGFSKPLGSFDNISMEETILGESGSDVLSQVHSPNQVLECTVMKDATRKRSTLNCFKKNATEVEYARSSVRRCEYIDVCHPKT